MCSIPSSATAQFSSIVAALGMGLALVLGTGGCAGASETQEPEGPTKKQVLKALAAASDTSNSDSLRVRVEQPPELIGGMEALLDDVEYPESAQESGVEGTVYVKFVVDKEGDPEELEIARGAGPSLNRAAMEAVRRQEFRPGMRGEKPVRVPMTLPVKFYID